MTPHELSKQHVCYTITAHDRTVYVGVLPYCDLYRLTDARSMPLWSKVISDNDTIAINVFGKFADRAEAVTMQQTLIATFNPYMNTQQATRSTNNGRIECVDTGEIFDNATVAAEAASVTRQAMSKHLTGATTAVRGKRYRRLT